MKIKKFNESSSIGDEVWTVVQHNDGIYSSVDVFSTDMKAYDYFIQLVNLVRSPDYEPFERYFENGVRLFRHINENPDLIKAEQWIHDIYNKDEWDISIERNEIR